MSLEFGGEHLLVILSILVVDNVEELELVDTLGGGDDAQPVAELHLLQELLGEVLEVAARQVVVGNDLDLAVTDLGDLNGLAQVADTALDLDALVQVLLESGDIEDLVAGGLRSVDDELLGDVGRLAGLLLQERKTKLSLLRSFWNWWRRGREGKTREGKKREAKKQQSGSSCLTSKGRGDSEGNRVGDKRRGHSDIPRRILTDTRAQDGQITAPHLVAVVDFVPDREISVSARYTYGLGSHCRDCGWFSWI